MMVMVVMLMIMAMMLIAMIMSATARVIAVVVMPMLMPMVMIVPVVMPMMMLMAVLMAVLMIVIMLRRFQRGRNPLLDARSLLARRCRVLGRHRHDLGRERDIVGPAEIVTAQPPRPVEDQQRRCAAHFVGRHRLRNAVRIRRIDADRERPAILLEENVERSRCHHRVMFEHRMQADDRDLGGIEAFSKPFGLRQSVLQTARAQHLEGNQHDHAPA